MSDLVKVRRFGVAQLPALDLLGLHVTPDFLSHVQRGDLEVPIIENIAEACHEAWRKAKEDDGYIYGEARNDDGSNGKQKTHPRLKPYKELSDAHKEDNRITARLTAAKLQEAGFSIERADTVDGTKVVEAFDQTARARLIAIEHDVWLRSHLLDGYVYAATTNDKLRVHRCVAPLHELVDEDKKLDVEIVDSLIPALRKDRYAVVKIQGSEKQVK